MSDTLLTDAQIERWRTLWEEMSADNEYMASREKEDARRRVVRAEILELLTRFLDGQIETEELREVYDHKTRTEWDVFGLKGMSGAMFLNKLVKHIPDQQNLAAQLRTALRAPLGEGEGRKRMRAFWRFLQSVIEAGQTTKGQLQPARTPFFISSWWHLQKTEEWPIFYVSGRRSLEAEGPYEPTRNPVTDYFVFRKHFLNLASALGFRSWELEHLLAWRQERKVGPPRDDASIAVLPVVSSIDKEPEKDEEAEGSEHTQIQFLLAQVGKKLGCRIWIAANDHKKEHLGKRLGELSIEQLPGLGMGSESQRIISLIDVIWLKGRKQVVAAFEVEHTTSVYSGLLRMSDLVVASPNLNFPLYIVAPEARLEKVRRELSRPMFQALELHKRCGLFSFETLNQQAEAIMRWASDPSAIDRLAQKVEDVPY